MADKVEKSEAADDGVKTSRRSFLKGGIAGVGLSAAIGGGSWAAMPMISPYFGEGEHAKPAAAHDVVIAHKTEDHQPEQEVAGDHAADTDPDDDGAHKTEQAPSHDEDHAAADKSDEEAAEAAPDEPHAEAEKDARPVKEKSTHASAKSPLSPDEALRKLKAGNRKYAKAPGLCRVDLLQRRQAVAESQAPWATVLTCADSRVAPEILFGGLSLGELFVCRNAGNMADTATLGTIEYGAEHLGSPLIVVLGHERCGAVAAACQVAKEGTALPGSIGAMVNAIVPAALSQVHKHGDFVDNVVRESARRTAEQIRSNSAIIRSLVEQGRVKIVYGHYDLDTGLVEFLG
jgi:carbonic anhydrase